MISVGYFEIILAMISYVAIYVYRIRRSSNGLPKAWPIVGMIPAFFFHINDFLEYVTMVLQSSDCNFMAPGLWLSSSDRIFFTADPGNVRYMMSTNFGNFPKGPLYKRTFDIFGDGIFNVDFDSWKAQRRMTERLLVQVSYHKMLTKITRAKLQDGLRELLDRFCERSTEFDLQDVFIRLAFNLTCMTVTGFDPGVLSADTPEAKYSNSMSDAEEVIFYRHVFPEWSWKLPRIFGIRMDAKLMTAWKAMDEIIWGYIKAKRKGEEEIPEGGHVDMMAAFMLESSKSDKAGDDRFVRDATFNFLFAGAQGSGATMMWVFWCLSKNPMVESKLREEIDSTIQEGGENGLEKLVDKMVYLHGAVCETLRLYPPIPFQHKCPTNLVVLPSGHRVDPKTKILICTYAMGRMKSIWGEDCLEFKPERWITEKGKIKHQPSHKFFTFHTGPRACLGKDIAISQLKIIVAFIIRNYKVHVVEGQKAEFTNSILLRMRHGLKVRITKRRSA
ncbi:hypothetical protein MLD38_028446 [Melastoma candidum]|uniref:Uncharacterized protein n=1 Tax=Melastoma candidum TaxID=119954 RepID=A0ACB9N153_9MYRT|nr:hypothetical protein MLD38_028446 [Melastoma candidum]